MILFDEITNKIDGPRHRSADTQGQANDGTAAVSDGGNAVQCAFHTGAIVSASIITLLIPPRASTLLAGFLGCLMTLLFIQLASAAIRILAQAFEDTRLVRAQRPVIAGLVALAGIAVFYILATTDKTIVDILSDFRHSVPGVIALAPFTVFSELLLSTRLFPELVGWTAVAVAINVALLAVIVALDERTSDQALAANSRLAERWMRIKRGGSMWASDKTTSRSVARAPAFGGLCALCIGAGGARGSFRSPLFPRRAAGRNGKSAGKGAYRRRPCDDGRSRARQPTARY